MVAAFSAAIDHVHQHLVFHQILERGGTAQRS
jgi:hypothetical protein